MYKVLLVDDEIRNYNFFEKMVNWEDKGFEIIGTAADGVEALKKYEELQPDLIFMDVQLPMMDGMECIRWIREVDRNVQIVIVSAYGDFNYAQKAIRYGVQDFLLKPVSRVMLNQIVNQMKENLDHREKNSANWFNNELAADLKDWINSDDEKFKKLNSSEENSLFRILIKERNIKDQTDKIKKTLETLEESGKFQRIRACVLTENYIYLAAAQGYEDEIKDFIKELEQQNYQTEVYCWTENASEEEKQSFRKPDPEFENYGFYENPDNFYCIDQMPYTETEIGQSEYEKMIQDALLHNEPQILENYVRQTFEIAYQQKVKPRKLKEWVLELLLYLKLNLNKYEGVNTTSILRNVRVEEIYRVYSAQKLEEYLTDKINEVFEDINMNNSKGRLNSIVIRAKSMADEHYCEKDFSVQKVADEIGISKNYFISLYKTQSGTGYWEYVTQLRMEKAQKLLRLTDDTIVTIAEKVGYDSEYYFSRKFKAYHGMSPREYRKIHSK